MRVPPMASWENQVVGFSYRVAFCSRCPGSKLGQFPVIALCQGLCQQDLKDL